MLYCFVEICEFLCKEQDVVLSREIKSGVKFMGTASNPKAQNEQW